MHRIGIIGNGDGVSGFRAAGISVYPTVEANEAERILHRLAEEGFAVIFVVEEIAKDILPAMEKYNTAKCPAIVPIPGNQGLEGMGMRNLRRAVEKAVGADILFKG